MQYKIKLQENHKLKMKYQTLKNSISRSEMLTDGITEDPTEITENTYLTDSDLSDEVDIESESDERKSKKNPLKIIRNQKRVSSPESGAIKKHITNKTNHLLNQKPRTTSFISNRNEKSKNTIPDSEDPNINKIQETISFENILSDPIKLAYFKDFLCEQFSQELVLCLIAIQKFKSISDSSKMLIHSTIIFKKFIRPESLFEINLNIEVRNQIQERILKNDIEITMFDQIENTILEDLKNNYYTPFIRSTHMALYQKHKNNEEEKENTTNQKTQQKEIKAIMVSKRREHSTLNEGYVFKGISREPHVIGEELAELMIDMCAAHFSISTEQIDFDQISQTIIFRRFVIATSELQVISLDNIDYPERLALFINIYNVLFVHSAIVSGVPTDKATKTRFMNESKYNIGGYLFSLSDIKHGILRGNRPKRNWRSGSYFKPKDKRANLQVVPLDPRIHFALTNLTIQSAPLRVYYLDRLNDELENTTKSFLLKNVRVSIKSKKILLPKVFRSSPKDFGQNQKDIFRFLSRYIPDLFQELSPNAFTIKFIGSNLSPMLVFESEYSSI
ncbi:electron carrier/ protein disulfide oxidoreductase [Anaeramoeba ignava]|uniref:Electron carrier/ protein disulfide oxidoreductase n=1 Tax=Anaeramoeba ignava TaxID=1746090 RepID=A0A9Q0LKG0_ANAIG|nr:electron carrier/ protein disulfide oxidoreductase [Anaeramoeba ignava]